MEHLKYSFLYDDLFGGLNEMISINFQYLFMDDWLLIGYIYGYIQHQALFISQAILQIINSNLWA